MQRACRQMVSGAMVSGAMVSGAVAQLLAPLLLALMLLLVPLATRAVAREISLATAPELSGSGFLKYLLPRFSLKTGIRVQLLEQGAPDADASLLPVAQAPGGARSAFAGGGLTYAIALAPGAAPNPDAKRFADWLLSKIGQRTVAAFKVDGKPVFTAAAAAVAKVAAAPLSGNARKGAVLAKVSCGRCHVVSMDQRMRGIGSTPSFALLRGFADWRTRFEGFFTRRPHPSFTQIDGVTVPFAIDRPPPIHPLRLTLDEVENITAYAAGITPADLGAPLQPQ